MHSPAAFVLTAIYHFVKIGCLYIRLRMHARRLYSRMLLLQSMLVMLNRFTVDSVIQNLMLQIMRNVWHD